MSNMDGPQNTQLPGNPPQIPVEPITEEPKALDQPWKAFVHEIKKKAIAKGSTIALSQARYVCVASTSTDDTQIISSIPATPLGIPPLSEDVVNFF